MRGFLGQHEGITDQVRSDVLEGQPLGMLPISQRHVLNQVATVRQDRDLVVLTVRRFALPTAQKHSQRYGLHLDVGHGRGLQ